MSKKSLTAITFCVTAILIIWMLHGSLCEIRMSFWERSLRRSYNVSSKKTRDGGAIPRQSVAGVKGRNGTHFAVMNITNPPCKSCGFSFGWYPQACSSSSAICFSSGRIRSINSFNTPFSSPLGVSVCE